VWRRTAACPDEHAPGSPSPPPTDPPHPADPKVPFFRDDYFLAALSGEANWVAYYQGIHGSAPTCPYLLGDFSDPQNGVDFLDITPFANSIGQECVFYGGGT
jgi:hypothetical protein